MYKKKVQIGEVYEGEVYMACTNMWQYSWLMPFSCAGPKRRTRRWQLGNISEALYGQQDKHEEVRSTLVNFMCQTRTLLWSSSRQQQTLLTNLQRMQRWGTWATHLEIFAAVSKFTKKRNNDILLGNIQPTEQCYSQELYLRHNTRTEMPLRNGENEWWQPTKHPPQLGYHVDLVDWQFSTCIIICFLFHTCSS